MKLIISLAWGIVGGVATELLAQLTLFLGIKAKKKIMGQDSPVSKSVRELVRETKYKSLSQGFAYKAKFGRIRP